MNAAITMWESYRDGVYKEGVSKNQERECSRAFYAGMYAAFKQLVELSDSVSDEELASEHVEEFRRSIILAAKDTLS